MAASSTERVKFVRLDLEHPPGNRCRARVELERTGQRYVGTAEGMGSRAGELRCAAQASLEALRQAAGADEDAFKLLDVDTVKAFDAPAVIVALSVHHHNETRRLVGFCLAGQDAMRAAALAVLSGTNRFLDITSFSR